MCGINDDHDLNLRPQIYTPIILQENYHLVAKFLVVMKILLLKELFSSDFEVTFDSHW